MPKNIIYNKDYINRFFEFDDWEIMIVNDTLKLSHLPRSMFKKRGVKVSHC